MNMTPSNSTCAGDASRPVLTTRLLAILAGLTSLLGASLPFAPATSLGLILGAAALLAAVAFLAAPSMAEA